MLSLFLGIGVGAKHYTENCEKSPSESKKSYSAENEMVPKIKISVYFCFEDESAKATKQVACTSDGIMVV